MLAFPAQAIRPLAAMVLLLTLTWAEWWTRVDSRRRLPFDWRGRAANLLLGLLSALAAALLPLSTIAMAAYCSRSGLGLFNWLHGNAATETAAAIVLLDLALYCQHRAFHVVPMLWRLHRVHHSASAFNATLGMRFHPIEIVLSLLYKGLLIVALGPSVIAVIAYETLLVAFSLLTHADLSLPASVDGIVRWVLVTPDWHRVHHSPLPIETNSNFGNGLSVWDRLFRTGRDVPRNVDCGAVFGLDDPSLTGENHVGRLLVQPWTRGLL